MMTQNIKSVKLDNYFMFGNDFEKAFKYEEMKKRFSGVEKEHYDNIVKISNCIDKGIDIPTECVSKFEKCINHFSRHKKEYLVIGAITVMLLGNSFFFVPIPSPVLEGFSVQCAAGMPTVNIGAVTSMLENLVANLIKIGVGMVSASCIIDMIKHIVQGNISHLPKSLITHGLMVCSLFLSPTVFDAISKAFGM